MRPVSGRLQDAPVNDRPRCAHCGDIIGVYEPARLRLADGTTIGVPPLTLWAEPVASGSVVLHATCSDVFAQEPPEGQADAGA
jgi:hypothetical protein